MEKKTKDILVKKKKERMKEIVYESVNVKKARKEDYRDI